jgi:hypothetical protein
VVEIVDMACGCLSRLGLVKMEVPGEKRVGTGLVSDGLVDERGDGGGRLGEVGKNGIL